MARCASSRQQRRTAIGCQGLAHDSAQLERRRKSGGNIPLDSSRPHQNRKNIRTDFRTGASDSGHQRAIESLRGVAGNSGQSAGHFRTVPDTLAGQELSGRVAVLEAEKRGLQALLQEKDSRIEELRHTVRLLEFKPAVPMPVPAQQVPEPDAKPNWMPAIIAAGVFLLTVLALGLHALGVIRLGR